MSSPSPEADNKDAVTVLSDTPIAEALRQAREDAGLSVSTLARSAQTSRAAIHAYETGAREPNVGTALRLLQACGYTMGIIADRRWTGAAEGRTGTPASIWSVTSTRTASFRTGTMNNGGRRTDAPTVPAASSHHPPGRATPKPPADRSK